MTVQLGFKPVALDVPLTTDADFIATITTSDGSNFAAGAVVTLELTKARAAAVVWQASISGGTASWNKDKALVNALVPGTAYTAKVRYTDNSGADLTWFSGKVDWNATSNGQAAGFTLNTPTASYVVVVPVPGPAGTGGGGGAVSSVFARTGDVVAQSGDYATFYQPLDSDLSTIAAIDSSVAGALVTDGAGWIKKTYAQLKTALGLVKADVGLGNVDNTSDVNKPVSTAQQAALDLKANLASPALSGTPTAPTATNGTNTTQIATTAFVQSTVTGAVAGLYDLRGSYDASVNTFPASGGSGAAGAVLKGDVWVITVAGTLGGTAVVAGDQVLALIDTPGQTAANWSIYEHDLGYTPENVANKSTSGALGTSDTLYPTQHAVKTYADAVQTAAATDATTKANSAVTTAETYADGKVEDSVTSGHHTIAPSGDAVSAALAAKLAKANNLSDLASAPTARTNLGLGGAAVLNVGTTTGTVAAGDDARLAAAASVAGIYFSANYR